MKFKELNNKEWVFIYTYLSEIKNHYDDIIENKGIEHVIKGPLGKDFSFFQTFNEDILEKVLNSGKYNHLERILSKINPIYDIINDSDPAMVKKVNADVLNQSIDELLNADNLLDDEDPDENM